MDTPSLGRMLAPKSIAVVGVSRDPRNIGHRYLRHLLAHGYPRKQIQIVHPSADEILGLPTLPNVGELTGAPDLALILTAGPAVPGLLGELVERGVGAVNVFANDGPVIEQPETLLATLEGTGTRLLGPNSPGFIATRTPTAAHATQMLASVTLRRAPVGIVSHSGAIGGIVGRSMLEAGAGFDLLVCTGNEIDLGLGECLHYMAAERELRAIGLFVETIRDVEHFRAGLRIARERGIKVCALKVGWSEAARRAASAHTGADAGRVDLFAAELHREGATLCRHIEEMVAKLVVGSLPKPASGGLLIGATSGGLTSALGDAATFAGLDVPALEGFDNPWDTDIEVVHQPQLVGEKWMRALDRDDVAAGIFALSAQPDEVMEGLGEGMSRHAVDKPFIVIPFAGLEDEPARALPPNSAVWSDAASACEALAWSVGPTEPARESDFDGARPSDDGAALAELGLRPAGEADEAAGVAVRLAVGDHPVHGRYATLEPLCGGEPASLLCAAGSRSREALAESSLGAWLGAFNPQLLDRLATIVDAVAARGPVLLDPLLLPFDPRHPPAARVWSAE